MTAADLDRALRAADQAALALQRADPGASKADHVRAGVVAALQVVADAVRELHMPFWRDGSYYCRECFNLEGAARPWTRHPCTTTRILEGFVTADWKTAIANRATAAVDHDLVVEVMAEYADNMGFDLAGLPKYGLAKVAHYAAMVAIAQTLGIDADAMRLTADEAHSVMWRRAAELVVAGLPVFTVNVTGDADPSWAGDVTSYEPLAREQAKQHESEGEPQ